MFDEVRLRTKCLCISILFFSIIVNISDVAAWDVGFCDIKNGDYA